MLPQNETRIGWSELERKARSQRMSLRTLRKHLDELDRANEVCREVDTLTRPPRVYYRLQTSKIFHGIFDRASPLMLDTKRLVRQISEVEAPDFKNRATAALIEMQTNLLIMEAERIWEFGATLAEAKRAHEFYKIMTESYLAPIILDLGLVCRNGRDVLATILPSFYKPYAERYNKASTELMAAVSASQATDHKSKHTGRRT
jgi:hypothetical protein